MSPDEPEQPAGEPSLPPLPDRSMEPGMPTPGPAWHRQPMRPEDRSAEPPGEAPGAVPYGQTPAGERAAEPGAAARAGGAEAAPPSGPPPGTLAAGETPPGGAGLHGGHLAAGVFLFLGGISVLGGLLALLSAEGVGFPVNSIGCGIAFAALFLLAVGLRGSTRLDPLRSTFGVLAVLFLTACFAFAVVTGDGGSLADQGLRIKAAGASAVTTAGMLLVAVLVPSAVAAGFAVLALQAALVFSLLAAGMDSASQLGVSALVAAVVSLIVAVRLPALRPHRRALAWMLSVAALLAAGDALGPAIGFNGAGVAASGVLGMALALIAWRYRLVVPAIAAVPALGVLEAYLVDQVASGTDANGRAVAILVIGVVTLLLVGLVAAGLRGRAPAARPGRAFLPEELLLVAVVVLALISLGETTRSPIPFFGGSSGGTFGGSSVEPPTPFPSLPPG